MSITLTIPSILLNTSIFILLSLLSVIVIFGFMRIVRHFYTEKGLYGFLVMYVFCGKSAEYMTAVRIMKAFQILKDNCKNEELETLILEIDSIRERQKK